MSGIYFPGMEMPECHFKTSESYNVHGFWMVYPDGTSKLHIFVGNDLWECGAVPVPDHGDLIDRDALWKKINRICDRRDAGIISDLTCLQQILSAVRHMPAIIPADKEA